MPSDIKIRNLKSSFYVGFGDEEAELLSWTVAFPNTNTKYHFEFKYFQIGLLIWS
jgi:hypothetical protein